MGMPFDPSMLMSILQKQSGGAAPSADMSGTNKFATFPSSNNSTPDAAPSAPPPPAPPSNSAPPPGAPPQSQPQQDQRLQGIKGYLSNILHGVGEGMKAHLGMETDSQQQQRLFKQNIDQQRLSLEQQNIQSEVAQRAAQVKQMQSAVTLPNGMQVPFALAKPYIDAWGKQQAAATGKRYMIVPNVGMLDTQPEGGGAPKLVPGSTSTGVTVTAEIAQQYNMPQQLVGHTLPLGQFAQMERGGAAWAGNVSNTTETRELADGSIVQIPKTTTNQKVAPSLSTVAPTGQPQIPGQPSAPMPKAPVNLSTRGGVKTLIGPDGQPLQGKSAADTVYATDPKTGQTIFTNRSDASAQGLINLQKVGTAQSGKDKMLVSNVADIQRKIGDYQDTFNDSLTSDDKVGLAYVMDHTPVGQIHGLGQAPLSGMANNALRAAGMNSLSDTALHRLVLYKQAQESLTAMQQAKTGTSRASDKTLELHIDQLPLPGVDKDIADYTLGQFQPNIDYAAQSLPVFPGNIHTQQSVKAEQTSRRNQAAAIAANQAKGANIPARPSNVPGNFIYKANGQKGAGWYRP